MTELRRIAAARREWIAAGKRGVLAHLVSVEGSHYRRPGARMLLAESGESIGSISGGCLDADLRRRIPEAIAGGRPTLVEYDTGSPEDVVFGLGLGCGGKIGVLVCPLASTKRVPDPLDAAAADRRASVIATVVRSAAAGPRAGEQVRLGGDGVLTAGDPALAAAVRPVLSAALRDRAATPFRAVLPGLAELLVEPVPEPVTLLLAGSGEEIAALARIAAELGWDVEVVLPRVPAAIESRIAAISGGPVRSAGDLSFLISRRTAIVVATHNYLDDLDVLRSVLATSAAYVGVLGSRGRVDRLCADAAVAGDVSRIRGPAGLDVGAETPGEIALSIAAEIQAVLCGRDGGPLRAAGGAIHARTPGESEPAWAIGAQP